MFPSYLKNPLLWPLLVPLVPMGVALNLAERAVSAISFR